MSNLGHGSLNRRLGSLLRKSVCLCPARTQPCLTTLQKRSALPGQELCCLIKRSHVVDRVHGYLLSRLGRLFRHLRLDHDALLPLLLLVLFWAFKVPRLRCLLPLRARLRVQQQELSCLQLGVPVRGKLALSLLLECHSSFLVDFDAHSRLLRLDLDSSIVPDGDLFPRFSHPWPGALVCAHSDSSVSPNTVILVLFRCTLLSCESAPRLLQLPQLVV